MSVWCLGVWVLECMNVGACKCTSVVFACMSVRVCECIYVDVHTYVYAYVCAYVCVCDNVWFITIMYESLS